MSKAQETRQQSTGWGTIAVGFALQLLGLGIDSAYHLAHPHGTAPLWAHLPIYVGAVVVLGGAFGATRGKPSDVSRRLGFGGSLVEVCALLWSLAVRAEANSFYVPAVLGALGGGLSFVVLARAWWVERRQVRARPAFPS